MFYRVLLITLFVLVSCDPNGSRATGVASPTTALAATADVPAQASERSPTPASDVRSFPQTGHTLRGTFRKYWERNGGLAIFGFPLTEQITVDGKVVQYFERARFEQAGTAVQLGLLGSEQGGVTPGTEPVKGCRFFAETGHNLCPPFLTFWQQRGGLAIFGLPLGEPEHDNDMLVQRFERARLEQPQPPTIQLARLGDVALSRLPGGALLRPATAQPAAQQATAVAVEQSYQPLDIATVALKVAGYDGPAEATTVDRSGRTATQQVVFKGGQAQLQQQVLGALGSHGVVVTIGGKVAGVASNAFRSEAKTTIATGQPRFDRMLDIVHGFMDQDISEYTFGTHKVHGYRSPDSNLLWLRDHVHQGKGYAYWETDMRSLLDQFALYQRPNGEFDDYMASFPWGEIRGRTEVEADNEYLFIEGVYRAWQATGDDDWLRGKIEPMERGLKYIRTDPNRWDSEHQLVKRPFTVDTWDFEYGPQTTAPDGKKAPRHWIDANTKWSIFHGDNTGYAYAMKLLAQMYQHLDNKDQATYWFAESDGMIKRLNGIAWNGHYFRHMVHLVPVQVPGVDEEQQLSLSNAYALGREVVNQEQARAILYEYQKRRKEPGAPFQEWYSINPPFPQGSLSTDVNWGKNPGEYVNGGVMPLVGGELARGAMFFGYERYGLDILQRYYSLVDGTKGTYLWYYPDGRPGISSGDTLSTDGWGSSAMLAALIEGVAGVRDEGKLFDHPALSPRWTAADDVNQARVTVRYGASDGYVAYQWQRESNGLGMTWTADADSIHLHLLLPENAPEQVRIEVNGQPQTFTTSVFGSSRYADLSAPGSGSVKILW